MVKPNGLYAQKTQLNKTLSQNTLVRKDMQCMFICSRGESGVSRALLLPMRPPLVRSNHA